MATSKYTARAWKNAPDKTTPINATALNNMETGISNAVNGVIALESQVSNLNNIINYNGAGIHNSIHRGKSLGTFTSAQSTNIRNGTFTDMFVGDYWTINGTTYYVGDCDYMLRCGDTDLTTHHILVVPASPLYNQAMNATDTTERSEERR